MCIKHATMDNMPNMNPFRYFAYCRQHYRCPLKTLFTNRISTHSANSWVTQEGSYFMSHRFGAWQFKLLPLLILCRENLNNNNNVIPLNIS